ncbi:MAG: FAD/FMN-containing dehydrogenase [Betaproteobacteria bacterium HGW-Betaproteobacteria-7]|jgi:hypothetical protein|nr:MAG: FAD/FMN-containing dehydrogenase [Betaproteobacteria bacterium HGW-Betaproteobacteria-7]
MINRLLAALALSLVSFAATAQATPLQTGDALPALTLNDQHEKPYTLTADTRQILFAADNGGAGLVMAELDRRGATWLKETKRAYLADIHKMPSLVTRLFAMPKLREKAYPIALGREAADLAMYPRKKDCVSLLPIEAGKLGEVTYACDATALQAALR